MSDIALPLTEAIAAQLRGDVEAALRGTIGQSMPAIAALELDDDLPQLGAAA